MVEWVHPSEPSMLITAFTPGHPESRLPTVYAEGAAVKTMFMPALTLQAWVVALRSGKYNPGRFRMFNKGSGCFCPLGILEMAVSGEIEQIPNGELMSVPSKTWLDNHSIRFIIPDDVPYSTGEVVIPYLPSVKLYLTQLNDLYHVTQTQMADLIEDHTEILEP
jgi:hypothetical protein